MIFKGDNSGEFNQIAMWQLPHKDAAWVVPVVRFNKKILT